MDKVDIVLWIKVAVYGLIFCTGLFFLWKLVQIPILNVILLKISWFIIMSILVSTIIIIIIQLIHGSGWRGIVNSINLIWLFLLVSTLLTAIVIMAPFWQLVVIEVNKTYKQKLPIHKV